MIIGVLARDVVGILWSSSRCFP